MLTWSVQSRAWRHRQVSTLLTARRAHQLLGPGMRMHSTTCVLPHTCPQATLAGMVYSDLGVTVFSGALIYLVLDMFQSSIQS